MRVEVGELGVKKLRVTLAFHNRLVRLAMDTSNLADDLLTQMYHNSKKPAASTPTATAAPAAPAAPSAPPPR